MALLSEDVEAALHEASKASRWFEKARNESGSDILRPKKPSLHDRFVVQKAPGNKWTVMEVESGDNASFRALDEIAVWIEQVSNEKID